MGKVRVHDYYKISGAKLQTVDVGSPAKYVGITTRYKSPDTRTLAQACPSEVLIPTNAI